jgi:hypothetical protein
LRKLREKIEGIGESFGSFEGFRVDFREIFGKLEGKKLENGEENSKSYYLFIEDVFL